MFRTNNNEALNKSVTGVLIIESNYSNPNGDTTTNAPRIDQQTNHGVLSSQSIKYKIRAALAMMHGGEEGNNVLLSSSEYLPEDIPLSLNAREEMIYEKAGVEISEVKKKGNKKDDDEDSADDENSGYIRNPRAQGLVDVTTFACDNFIDIRLFGGALSAAKPGLLTLRGPVRFEDGISVAPVYRYREGLSRCYRNSDKEVDENESTFGEKYKIAHGLYVMPFHINAAHTQKSTGVSEKDLEMMYEAIEHMFDITASAARPNMRLRKFFILETESKYGDQRMNDVVSVKLKDGVEYPRSFDDYDILINEVPEGITLTERI